MNRLTKDALPRRRDLLAALGSLGVLPIACNAVGGELGQKYSGQNFSFYYPPEWRLSGNDLGKMASDPDGRYLGIEFLPGSNNRPSWAQLCQSLDDLLIARAQKLEREADSINEQRHAGPFEKMQVTFEGPHPGNPGTLGGRNIRISTVFNRGGFNEVIAWDQWVTAVVRSNGIYLVSMRNPRSDRNAQVVWDKFTRSVDLKGGRVSTNACA